MKKLTILLLATLFAFSTFFLVACGGEPDAGDGADDTNAGESGTTPSHEPSTVENSHEVEGAEEESSEGEGAMENEAGVVEKKAEEPAGH